MARFAFVADVHLGNHRRYGGEVDSRGLNARCRLALDALRGAFDVAEDSNCATLVVLGDLFDDDRPSPQLVAAVQEVFHSYRSIRPVLLAGNHDQRTGAPGDNALAPLEPVANVLDQPGWYHRDGVWLLALPAGADLSRDWSPPSDQPGVGAGPRVVLVHKGLSDERTPAFLRASGWPASEADAFRAKYGAGALFAGDWHQRASWPGLGVHQVGALVPTGWDNPGLSGYGGVAIWDSLSPTFVSFAEVPGPRFVRTLPDASAAVARGCVPFAELVVRAGDLAAAREAADAADLPEGAVVAVVPSADEARARAQASSAAARAGATLDEAVARFVSQLALPDGVAPDDVVAAVRSYLA